MPKVSVIIPVYNTENFLPRCLESVCNQTLSDIEIICINDCSTDNSLEVLKKYPVKIIDLPENKGAAYARNRGIEAATGEYIGFVDSDDFVDLDFYEKLYTKAIETEADIVKGKLFLYNLEKNIKYLEDWIDINDKIKTHPAYFYFTFTSAIYKKSFIIKNNIQFLEGLVHFEDPYFTIKASLFNNKLELIDNACYFYTNNSESVSRNVTDKHVEGQVKGSEEIILLLNKFCNNKQHYLIVFNFVLQQLLDWCNRTNCSDSFNITAAKGLHRILTQNKYLEEQFEFYFLNKKKSIQKNFLKNLRNNVKKKLCQKSQ